MNCSCWPSAILNDSLVSDEDKTCTAWNDFKSAMQEKQYGAEETLNAWLWFKTGWSRGVAHNDWMKEHVVNRGR